MFDLLREAFPAAVIVAQHSIKPWGDKGKTLYCDYYLPQMRLVVECDGRQHSEFVAFFHRNTSGMERSVANDEAKDAWAKENKITMIRFSDKEKINQETLQKKLTEVSPNAKGKTKRGS